MPNSRIIPGWFNGFARNASECDPRHAHLWRGKIGHWCPFLGVTGGTVFDISGYRNHGTINGATWNDNRGLTFIRSNSNYINLGPSSQPSSNTLSTYMEYVMGSATGVNQDLITLGYNYSTDKGYLLHIGNSDKIQSSLGSSNTAGSFTVLTQGKTYSIVTTVNLSTGAIKAYINGVLEISDIEDATFGWDTTNYAGGRVTVDNLDGKINHIRLYDRILSNEEIWQLYVDPFADLRLRQFVGVKAPAAIVNAPTGTIYGPLMGALGGPI